jgi:molecular chaperone GrpE
MAEDPKRPGAEEAPEPDEIRDLREKAARAEEYLDLARRAKADFINYQERIRREREEWSRDAVAEFIRDFLPALDSFTWARRREPKMAESLGLIERELLNRLARHGIVPIPPSGDRFDPTVQEAVAAEETDEKPPGTILEQVRRGWKVGDQVLRPAGVRVAKAPAQEGEGARPTEPQEKRGG